MISAYIETDRWLNILTEYPSTTPKLNGKDCIIEENGKKVVFLNGKKISDEFIVSFTQECFRRIKAGNNPAEIKKINQAVEKIIQYFEAPSNKETWLKRVVIKITDWLKAHPTVLKILSLISFRWINQFVKKGEGYKNEKINFQRLLIPFKQLKNQINIIDLTAWKEKSILPDYIPKELHAIILSYLPKQMREMATQNDKTKILMEGEFLAHKTYLIDHYKKMVLEWLQPANEYKEEREKIKAFKVDDLNNFDMIKSYGSMESYLHTKILKILGIHKFERERGAFGSFPPEPDVSGAPEKLKRLFAHPSFCAFILRQGWYHYETLIKAYSPNELKNDKAFILSIAIYEKNAFELASESLQADPEVILACIPKHSGHILKDLPNNLKSDKAFMLEAIRKTGYCLEHASEDLRKDYEVVLAAVKSTGYALRYAHTSLLQDRTLVLRAFKTYGYALELVPHFKDDKEMVLAAVSENGNAIRYASERLQKDSEVIGSCRGKPLH